MAKKRRLLTEGVITLMVFGLVGGMLFANIAQWFVGGTAGKTVLGAIAGGYLCVYVGKRIIGLRRPLGDLFAVAISAGEAVGRWGCFFGGCCYGKSCSESLSAVAVYQHGALRYPTQIYLSIANLLILVILLRYDKTKPLENSLFYLQGLLYCIARFVIEFFRETPPPVMGLSTAQWACLVGILFFGFRFNLQSHAPLHRTEGTVEML